MQVFSIEEGAGGGGWQGSLLDKYVYIQIIVTECCSKEFNLPPPPPPPLSFKGNAE